MQRLPVNKAQLQELTKQCKHRNIWPLDLPFHLATAQPDSLSCLFAQLLEECRELLSIMSREEVNTLVDNLPPTFRMNLDHDTSLDIVAGYCLSAMVEDCYLSFKEIVSQVFEGSEVCKVYPEIRRHLDDDGLLHLDDNFKLLDVGVEYKGHILHYHQLLRRGYTMNPNLNFLYKIRDYFHRTKSINQFRIAIDYHRLMPVEYYQALLEKDWWFGPNFNLGQLDSPTAVGLTVVKRSKPSSFDLVFVLDRTEFYWSFKNETKVLEIEEISSTDFVFEPYYLNRYVHCEWSLQQRVFKHLDGAVKVYLSDKYQERLNTQMPYELKSFRKPKLFRIDGSMGVEDWTEIVSLFYLRNEMIIEYLNPEQFKELFGDRIRHHEKLRT